MSAGAYSLPGFVENVTNKYRTAVTCEWWPVVECQVAKTKHFYYFILSYFYCNYCTVCVLK